MVLRKDGLRMMNKEKRELIQVYLDERAPIVRIPAHRWPMRSRLFASFAFLIGANLTFPKPIIYEDSEEVFTR